MHFLFTNFHALTNSSSLQYHIEVKAMTLILEGFIGSVRFLMLMNSGFYTTSFTLPWDLRQFSTVEAILSSVL